MRTTSNLVLVGALVTTQACGTEADDQSFRSSYTTNSTLDGGDGGSCTSEDIDIAPRRSLFETSRAALAGFSMSETLSAAATNDGLTTNPIVLHDQMIDTYNEGPGLGLGGHCNDQLDAAGQPILNGHPLRCPRVEGGHIGDIDGWFPIAAVNRFDLAPADGSNCGEARLVFANNSLGRMFTIFEAQIPNPNPGCGLAACAPVQEFWASLSDVDDAATRGAMLHGAFITGDPALVAAGFGPFVRASNYSVGTGQVRTNNFDEFPIWTLREFKLVAVGLGGPKIIGQRPRLRAVEVPVAANLHGGLWDENAKHPVGEKCREAIVGTVSQLMNDDLNLMGVAVPTECLAAESEDNSSNEFMDILDDSPVLSAAIQAEILANDPSSTLLPMHIANRAAFAGACIGCHQQSTGDDLGNGVVGPQTLGFVHTDEFSSGACGDGTADCFDISDALTSFFLPHRENVMEQFLGGAPCCNSDIIDPPIPLPIAELDAEDATPAAIAEAEAAKDAEVDPMTIGGAPSGRTH
ncbi:MAG: hypothetical protein IAG13_06860 [Deltaproteobacteria bacterium]|nr:hypothetical protein [Nannocystaceae bacterium]